MTKPVRPFIGSIVLATSTLAAVLGPPKPPWQDRPDDRPCEHVERIAASRHAYVIDFHGTVDGTMTRSPVGYAAFAQGWQPNRCLLIENLGQTDVVNPRILVNSRRNWHTLPNAISEAVGAFTEPRDRARALYEFARRRRFHACTWDAECNDALKVLNVYGYTLCGDQALVLNDLWKAAGLTTRRGYPVGHCVGEVFYDGAYHLMDSDEHVVCLLRDNKTVASEADVVRDHDLIKRTHTYGIGAGENRQTDEFSASLYGYEGKREGDFGTHTRHSMDLVLRPGESIEFRWDHIGKQYSAGQAVKPGQPMKDGLGDLLAGWGQTAYDNLRNGKLCYRPDLGNSSARAGTLSQENVYFDSPNSSIRPADPSKPAALTWQFRSPYVFVGGTATVSVALAGSASAQWRYSADERTWTTIAAENRPGDHSVCARLDEIVSPRSNPTCRFLLRLVLVGQASARNLTFENDIQTSLLALPELQVGPNQVQYTDSTDAAHEIRIIHRWLERTSQHPPVAPEKPVAPQDGQTVEGSRVTFRWTQPSDPDNDAIADYHFELSEFPDMRWPLSPNFEKLISLTPSRGKSEWTTPGLGLLYPDTDYYWRVRVRDASGLWGPWSRAFRFRINAPGVPVNLALVPDGQYALILTWSPNPVGRPAAAWKVYGSDEKGFSVSDTEYNVFRGKGFVTSFEEYAAKPADAPDAGSVKTPPNLIARTTDASLRVVGPDVTLPNTNKAFYRVVAVDSNGVESGSSDYAEVPRPFVYTPPPMTTAVSKPYRYQPHVIRSIGDLRCRADRESSYKAAFWDRETHTFTARVLPEGLTLDVRTGLVSGQPARLGTHEVTVDIADRFGKTKTLSYRLTVAP